MKQRDLEEIQRALTPYGTRVTPPLVQAICAYTELLLRWNARINLTRITDRTQILVRHFGESFFAAARLNLSTGTLADIGSGAGFPGLALKLVCPQLRITLIESNLKKATFLFEVVRKLDLQGVEVLRARMEALQDPESRFQFITARAVGGFSALLEWAKLRLSAGGQLILWLGGDDVELLSSNPGWTWGMKVRIPRTDDSYLLAGRPVTVK